MRLTPAFATGAVLVGVLLTGFTLSSADSARAERVAPCAEEELCDSIVFVDRDATFHRWHGLTDVPEVSTSLFGNPGDVPLFGDWDCDGEATPGMYRPSNGFVYLRNSNATGIADVEYFFGDAADIPLVGDFDGDGCDTLSVYRASEGKVYVKNALSTGIADYSFFFGNPGDKPFIGDFDGDGVDSIGLHRESTGFVYFRNSNTRGDAHESFFYGDPGDQLIAGDWNGDGVETVAAYRPETGTLYVKNSNEAGAADAEVAVAREFTSVLSSRQSTQGPGKSCEKGNSKKCEPAPVSTTTTAPTTSSTTTTTAPTTSTTQPPSTTTTVPPPTTTTTVPPPTTTTTVPPPTTTTTVPPPTTTTTTVPPPPPPPPPSSCSGVVIALGDAWQAKIDAHPAGTVFCVAPGVHSGGDVRNLVPKDGMQFIGEADAAQTGWMRSAQSVTSRGRPLSIVDGGWDNVVSCQRSGGQCVNGTGYGVHDFMHSDSSSKPFRNIVLKNLEIRDFESPRAGTVGGRYGTNWVMENLYVHSNIVGVKIGSSSKVRWSLVADNYQMGIISVDSSGGVFEDSELRNNNRDDDWLWHWAAGGSKFAGTTNFTARRNYVHLNHGPGLWADGDNVGTLYAANLVEDNDRPGIFHELSFSAIIRNNTVRRNGGSANIYLSNSAGTSSNPIQVYNNRVSDHQQWEIMIKDKENRPNRPDWIHIYDNTITHPHTKGKLTGVFGHYGNPDLTKNFSWWGNDYSVDSAITAPFKWGSNGQTWSGWKTLESSTGNPHDNDPQSSFGTT